MSHKRRNSNPFLVVASSAYRRLRTSSGNSTVVNVTPKKMATKFRVRDERSFTKTNTMNSTSKGEGLTSSTLTHHNAKVVRSNVVPKYVGSKMGFYSESSAQTILSVAGYGAGNVIAIEGSVPQIMVNSGTLTNICTNPDLAALSYLGLCPDVTIANTLGTGTVAQPSQNKFWLSSVDMDVSIANFGTADAVITLYLLEAVHDCNVAPDAYFNKQSENAANGAAATGNPGAGANTGGTIGWTGEDNVWGDFTQLTGFSKEYKTLKKMRFDLSAGSSHEQSLFVIMNYLADMDKAISKNTGLSSASATWTSANVNTMRYPKGTIFVYVHQRGCVIKDTTTGANNGAPTYASTNIGYLVKKNKKLKHVLNKGARTIPNLIYNQLAYNGAGTAQKFVSVVDGKVNYDNV